MTAARLADLVAELAGRPDAALVELLRRRPDLAVPAPANLGALAARAASRPSVERVLAHLDQHALEVAEAVCALSGLGPVDRAGVAAALGGEPRSVTRVLTTLTRLLLVVDGRPVAALVEALGPHPARLGPPLDSLTDVHSPVRTREELDRAVVGAPTAAGRVLVALTQGPPVGTVGGSEPGDGTRWLLDRGVLQRLGPSQVVLPLETGLAARGGRTHVHPHPVPPPLGGPVHRPEAVAAESARAAEELVRLVELVLRTWAVDPPAALRSGGLGVRELRRVAAELGTTPEHAATVVEVAAMAGLLAPDDDGERTVFVATAGAADWGEEELALRWALLAVGWLGSGRMPWLVGTRDDRGALRAPLGPGLERGWVARLRRRVLGVLAELPAGTAPDAAGIHAVLRWHAPRSTPPEASVAAVLAEAELLGITGAGALTAAGRALVPPSATGTAGPSPGDPAAPLALLHEVAEALAADLPAPVGEILVQGDLTAVVPGRPTRELAELLELVADVESRGVALTVRFSQDSVRRALDSGLEPATLLDRLRTTSLTPLPQALEYLVTDIARRHGRLRVGGASGYVRTPDEATTRALLADPRLAALGLRELAPTVLVSGTGPGELLDTLRESGAAPVLEGPAGSVVGVRSRRRTLRTAARVRTQVQVTEPDDAALARLVQRLRTAHQQAAGRRDLPATDPVHTVAALREASTTGTPVLVVVIGADGRPERRRVRPVSVEGGRARLQDLDREAELVVAIHRINAVTDL